MSVRGGARLLDGKALAKRIVAGLRKRVAGIVEQRGDAPLLAILSVGQNSASEAYLKQKLHACKDAGIETTVQAMPASTTTAEAAAVVDELAADLLVDGIVIESPLPAGVDADRLFERLPPEKDVEGLTPANYGRLFAAKTIKELDARGVFVPCTAEAILALLRETGAEPKGLRAVVIGRSNIVGKPAAHLLCCLNATVTLCHSATRDLAAHLKSADLVVCAAGRPGLVRGEMLKPGSIVIDAGTSFSRKTVLGDADAASTRKAVRWLTPVPGGVGPVTVAYLLSNTVLAAERRTRARLGD